MMKRWIAGAAAVFMAACAPQAGLPQTEGASLAPQDPATATPEPEPLPVLGKAPELHDGVWLNTDEPLSISGLQGKVVLLEMWTFGCYNCKNVMPALKEWHAEYGDDGLVIIGNHYPEFDYEKDLDNLKQAITDLEIPYAVIQDNGRETWAAYNCHAWPTMFLIDKWGNIRYTHIGEGRYNQTEAAIQQLLAETNAPADI